MSRNFRSNVGARSPKILVPSSDDDENMSVNSDGEPDIEYSEE